MKSTKSSPSEKKKRKSSPSHPTISLGVEERRLLVKIAESKTFIINKYADNREIARSTTRSRLKKLNRIGLIYYKSGERVKLLETGKVYLENTNQIKIGGESLRIGGRKDETSVHWHSFSSEIVDRKNFRERRLDFLDCSWMENKGMRNWNEYIVKFNDATVIIKPKTLKVQLYDIVDRESDKLDAICLRRLMDYIELFKDLGIITNGISLERGHWAKIESALGKWLYEKFEDRYELKLDDGSKFFIDFSPDKYGNRKLEEETDDKIVRERVDKTMNGISMGKYDLDNLNTNTDEIGEMRKMLGSITSMEKVRLMDRIEDNKLTRAKLEAEKKIITPQVKSDLNYKPSYIY